MFTLAKTRTIAKYTWSLAYFQFIVFFDVCNMEKWKTLHFAPKGTWYFDQLQTEIDRNGLWLETVELVKETIDLVQRIMKQRLCDAIRSRGKYSRFESLGKNTMLLESSSAAELEKGETSKAALLSIFSQ